ncbi:MAG: CBS domain-containing protein [Candidatus Aenigmarchaeota archaeon]|nr:CBS domain-containing protein [Candidatus Aenigmarchaeota archaeon]
MEIREIYKKKITPLNLDNSLKDAILKVIIINRKVPIVDKNNLVGALTDSDLLGIIVTKKYGLNERLKNIDYISFPITINKNENIVEAIKTIKKYNLGSLIVINGNNFPEYVLKDYELLDFIEVDGIAKDFMTKNPICAKLDKEEDLLKMLVFSKFRNLPVIDKEKNYLGILNVNKVLKSIYLNNFQTPKNIIQKTKTFDEYEDIKVIKKYLKENEAAIITKENKVTGIITPYDIIKEFRE